MPKAASPASWHGKRLEQGCEETEVAEAQLEGLEPCVAQRLDNEGEHGGVILLPVQRREGFDARLAELARVCASGATRLVSESRSTIAVASWNTADGMTRQMQAAGRDGQVRAETELLPIGVCKDVGACTQGFADHVEEDACRLDDGRRDLLIAGARKGTHQALRLGCKGLDLLRGFRGHILTSTCHAGRSGEGG